MSTRKFAEQEIKHGGVGCIFIGRCGWICERVQSKKIIEPKFNPISDTVKNFSVKLRTEANKAYLASVIEVVPAGAADAKTRRSALET